MIYQFSYLQRATVEVSGSLEIPDDIVAKGEKAVHDYVEENETSAKLETEIVDWHERLDESMEVEQP